jgi:hypothetical protein
MIHAIALTLTTSAPWRLNRLECTISSASQPLLDIREFSSILNQATQELLAGDRPAKRLLWWRAVSQPVSR